MIRRLLPIALLLALTACGDAEPKKGNNVNINNMMNNANNANNTMNNQNNVVVNNRNNQTPDPIVKSWADRAYAAYCQNDQLCPTKAFETINECLEQTGEFADFLAVQCTMVDSIAAEACINAIPFSGCDPDSGEIAIPSECEDQDEFLECDDVEIIIEDPGM